MRDKVGWAASSPRIANAQARLSGDAEMLSMMELLQRANITTSQGLHPHSAGLGIDRGPLTGPATTASANVFEQKFTPEDQIHEQSESPIVLKTPGGAAGKVESEESARIGPEIASPSSSHADPLPVGGPSTREEVATQTISRPYRPLKRTYTDVASYSLQHKVADALARPYQLDSEQASAISPTHAPVLALPLPLPKRGATMNAGVSLAEQAPHGHRNAQSQAIFTTDGQAPWTITAANDLACLVFGVTRAEIRKLGIMEVISETQRPWLEEKLKNPESGPTAKQQTLHVVQSAAKTSPSNSIASMGNGVTAKLLSKPPSRESYQSRRSKTENGSKVPAKGSGNDIPHHAGHGSRGVLLCGDVVPIRKMNGATGSASLWVKEKSGGLIWVLEEITEDVAYLTVDEIGSITRGSGNVTAIWGIERVRSGMDVQKLLPRFPKLAGTNTGALDYEAVARLHHFTARTSNSTSIPVSVERVPGESTFRVSSFPHVAGIMVLHPQTMRISSSNSVFSAALFGYATPDGMPITDLIPGFDKILQVMTDEDKIALVDGFVIPEQSFRRARALLALRQGSADAAAVFLRPIGLPARHRDGAEIMIDVQMRVVRSDRDPIYNDHVIDKDGAIAGSAGSEVVYALWITYSRQLHAANHSLGTVTPLISRPNTPPIQPRPDLRVDEAIPSAAPSPVVLGEIGKGEPTLSLVSQQLQEDKLPQSPAGAMDREPYEHPSPELIALGAKLVKKKRIEDFTVLEDMGQGAYGQVKLARFKKAAAKKMVIKYVTKRRILVDTWHRDRRLGTVPLEIHVLDYLRREGMQHPCIVEMADFFEDDINYYIEMVPHGLPGMDLFDYIELRVTMEEEECRKIFVQVAEAIGHLHIIAKVVHRDIKDENIVLDGEGKVKLVDFGSAAYIKNGPFDVFVGTIDYAAPEVLRGSPYRGKEQDVWALGILLYTIVYKENPFYSVDEIMDHDLRVPYVMSDDCIDLIRKMLDRDVEQRIGIEAVLEHPWCTAVVLEED